jgi:hypothetical protein
MTSAVSIRRLSDVWLLTLAAVGCATASGQQAPPSLLQEVHIGIQIRQLDGTPINYLKAKDFNVSAGGRSFRVSVTRPSLKRASPDSVQTRLLVILPSPPATGGADILSEAIDQLNPVWREGWRVAVRTPQGRLTPYVSSEQELQQAIRQIPTGQSTDRAAVDTLKDFAGRRLVMAVSNGDYGSLGSLGKAAAGVQAMLYNVGGNPYDNYSYRDTGGMTDNIAKPYVAQAQFFVEDERAERTFGTAVRDARNDARSYYDLSLQVEPGTSSLTLSISMELPYRVTAQAYTPTSDPPPEVVLVQKSH